VFIRGFISDVHWLSIEKAIALRTVRPRPCSDDRRRIIPHMLNLATIHLKRLCRRIITAAAMMAAVCAHAAFAQVDHATAPTTQPAGNAPRPEPSYTRVVEVKDRSIALELASRELVATNGQGPKVCLVGVAHIADRSFYQAVQRLLDEYDVVLYESVKPPGTGGAGGDTDQQRIESTQAALDFLAGVIKSFHERKGEYPVDFAALRSFTLDEEPRMAGWLESAAVDAWQGRITYARAVDGLSFTLTSFGADRTVGGDGPASDLTPSHDRPDPLALSREDSLQSQLAEALKLQFQLEALDYGRVNWRCSDMAIDQVSRELEKRGVEFGPLGGTLAGTSFPARVISILLGMIRVADTFLEGAIADTFKVVMIDLLGNEAMVERGIGQLGEGFSEVIVEQRNQVAVDDARRIIEREPDMKSIAILYGAAHMNDLEQRVIDQLHYQPAEVHWLPAMRVDFKQSAVSIEEVNQLRAMMKQMMRQR
jgi:hypothetical protein